MSNLRRLANASLLAALLGCSALLSDVDGPEAVRLVEAGGLLVDVRSRDEWNSGHIDGAIHIPHNEIAAHTEQLGDKERTIILYCASGVRSYRAQSTLEDLGFSDVRNLGAMDEWPAP